LRALKTKNTQNTQNTTCFLRNFHPKPEPVQNPTSFYQLCIVSFRFVCFPALTSPVQLKTMEPSRKFLQSKKDFQLEDLHDDNKSPVVFHCSGCKIFPQQLNIGLKVYEEFMGLFHFVPTELSGKKINLLVLSPSSVSLKAQTNSDLKQIKTVWHEDMKYPVFQMAECVNSSSLEAKDNPGSIWLDNFSTGDYINVLVHDECHWGVASDSRINNFFQRVLDVKNAQESKKLFVLLVSATPQNLTATPVNLENMPSVDWMQLMQDNPQHFACTSYRSWRNLTFEDRDRVDESTVVQGYITEMDKLNEVKVGGTDEHNDEDAKRILTALIDTRTQNCTAVIRLSTTAMAAELETKMNARANRRFNIMNLSNMNTEGIAELKDLEGRNLLITVMKLNMGCRLTKHARFMDLRARYPEKSATKAAMIQDFGRLAGHDKTEEAVVFCTNIEDVPRDADLLNPGGSLARGHPQYDEVKVYSQLQGNLVLLKAEPQIGKTGAILGFLHYVALSTWPSRDSFSDLKRLTLRWASLFEQDANRFFQEFADKQAWDKYHDLLESAKKNWKDYRLASDWTISQIIQAADYSNILVADCGCGRGGVAKALIKQVTEHKTNIDNSINVHGSDVCSEIDSLKDELSFTNLVTFHPHCGDMAFQTDITTFDFVIFSLSLFGNDVSNYMKWAYQHLKTSGKLLIIDIKGRKFENLKEALLKDLFDAGVGPLDDASFGKIQVCRFKKKKIEADVNALSVIEFGRLGSD
jgi:ubiquinone/menaquinone biosynthesis C-methylase UbiE